MKTKSLLQIESLGVPPPLFFVILSQKLIFFYTRELFYRHFVTIYTTFLYFSEILFKFSIYET